MILATVQQCPQCTGCISREHTATEELAEYAVTYIYCEFCSVGIETLWRHTASGNDEEVFTLRHNGQTNPVELGKFLQRLETARAA